MKDVFQGGLSCEISFSSTFVASDIARLDARSRMSRAQGFFRSVAESLLFFHSEVFEVFSFEIRILIYNRSIQENAT